MALRLSDEDSRRERHRADTGALGWGRGEEVTGKKTNEESRRRSERMRR